MVTIQPNGVVAETISRDGGGYAAGDSRMKDLLQSNRPVNEHAKEQSIGCGYRASLRRGKNAETDSAHQQHRHKKRKGRVLDTGCDFTNAKPLLALGKTLDGCDDDDRHQYGSPHQQAGEHAPQEKSPNGNIHRRAVDDEQNGGGNDGTEYGRSLRKAPP